MNWSISGSFLGSVKEACRELRPLCSAETYAEALPAVFPYGGEIALQRFVSV